MYLWYSIISLLLPPPPFFFLQYLSFISLLYRFLFPFSARFYIFILFRFPLLFSSFSPLLFHNFASLKPHSTGRSTTPLLTSLQKDKVVTKVDKNAWFSRWGGKGSLPKYNYLKMIIVKATDTDIILTDFTRISGGHFPTFSIIIFIKFIPKLLVCLVNKQLKGNFFIIKKPVLLSVYWHRGLKVFHWIIEIVVFYRKQHICVELSQLANVAYF